METRLIYFTLTFTLVIGFTSTVSSQPIPEQATGQATPEPATSQATPEPDSNESSESNDVEDLKKEVAAMKAKIREHEAKIEEYDAKFEQDGLDELSDYTDETVEQTEGIKISGFFDTTFGKNFIPEDVVPGRPLTEESTFFMQNFNVILTNHMSRKLSFLGELRFTFLPNGQEPRLFTLDEKKDTTVVDPHTQDRFKLGGLAIERVHLKWMPWEFFGVIAGYYLSPYGIWHLDHGSPIRLSILHPFKVNVLQESRMQTGDIVPDAQLGLQALGRLFFSDNLFFDYALTLSNGRGPADTLIDYDENKGLGLRLRFTYDKPDFQLALGGYGYHGTYTDKKPRGFSYDLLEKYSEYAVATDFLLAVYGLKLQSEFVRGLILYDEDSPRPDIAALLPPTPDYLKNAFYAMLSYELPLDDLLGSMTLTPYIAGAMDNPLDWIYTTSYWVGLNFKPSAYVTLKTELVYTYSDVDPPTNPIDKPEMWSWKSQLAVSF